MAKKIKISLTDFIDYTVTSGTKKMTKIKQIKNRGDYGREKDFYVKLRERIEKMHKNGESKDVLNELLTEDLHEHKKRNFPEMISGYKKFLGRKKIEWATPPRKIWKHKSLVVTLNPEVCLTLNKKHYVIKLHFRKDERLSKDKICGIIHLMQDEMHDLVEDGVNFAVLDVKNGKLHHDDKRKNHMIPLIKAEAEGFIKLWKDV